MNYRVWQRRLVRRNGRLRYSGWSSCPDDVFETVEIAEAAGSLVALADPTGRTSVVVVEDGKTPLLTPQALVGE